ncbi:hypothetical protein ACHAXS_008276 [Conticribra weissflogii]
MPTPIDAAVATGDGEESSPASQVAAPPAPHGHGHGHIDSHKHEQDNKSDDHHHNHKNKKVIVLPDGSRIIKSQKEKHLPDGSVLIKTKTESIPAPSPDDDNKKKKKLKSGHTNSGHDNNSSRGSHRGSSASASRVVKTETRRIRPNGASVTTTTTERIEMPESLHRSMGSLDSRDGHGHGHGREGEPEVLGAQTEVLPDGTRVVTSETRKVMKDGRVNVTSTVVKVVEGAKEDAQSEEGNENGNGRPADVAAVLDEAESNPESHPEIAPAPIPGMEGHQLEIDYSGTVDAPRPPGFVSYGADDRIQRKIQEQSAPQSSSFVPPGQNMGLEIDYSGTTSDPRPPGFHDGSSDPRSGSAGGTGNGGIMSLEDRIKQKIKEEDERKTKSSAQSYEERINQKIKDENNQKNFKYVANVNVSGLEIQQGSGNEPIPPEFASASANANRSAVDEKASYRRMAPPATRAGVQHVPYDGSSAPAIEKAQTNPTSTPASHYYRHDNQAKKNTSMKNKEEMMALLDKSNDKCPTPEQRKDEETGEYYDSQKDDYSLADKSQGAYSVNANSNADPGSSKQEGGFAALSHMVRASYDHDKSKPKGGGGTGGTDDLQVDIHDRRHSDKSSEYSQGDDYDKKPEDGFTKEGIAIAKAVDGDDDDGDGRPVYSAIEYDPNAKPPIYRNRRFQVYSALGLVLIAVIVTVAVVMTTKKTKEKEASKNKILVPPPPPTMAPTSYRDVSGVKEFLEKNVLFGNVTFDSIAAGNVNPTAANMTIGGGNSTVDHGNVTTGDGNVTTGNTAEDTPTFADLDNEDPRLVALDWILHKDAMQLEVYDENLSQRYILGLLAVAWDAGSWNECGPVLEDEEDVEAVDPARGEASSMCTVENNDTGLVQTYKRWLSDEDECDWYGVTCSGGHVRSIELDENNLIGTIVPELGMLPFLQIIDLSSNCIYGTLPSAIGKLNYLTNMDLKDNALSGFIPDELFNLTSLEKLDLSYNTNYGGNCTRVDGSVQDISSDGLEGKILDSNIGRLTHLQDVDLTNNYFSGSICEFSDSLMNQSSGYHHKHDSWVFVSCCFFFFVAPDIGKLTQLGMFRFPCLHY